MALAPIRAVATAPTVAERVGVAAAARPHANCGEKGAAASCWSPDGLLDLEALVFERDALHRDLLRHRGSGRGACHADQ